MQDICHTCIRIYVTVVCMYMNMQVDVCELSIYMITKRVVPSVAGSLGARRGVPLISHVTMEGCTVVARCHITRSEAKQQVHKQRTAMAIYRQKQLRLGGYRTLLEQPCQVQASGERQWQ